MKLDPEREKSLERERAARAEAETARAEAESARAEAVAAHARFSFLAEASRVLGTSLDYETTLRNLARLVVPALGDFCAVDLAEEGARVRRVAVADVDPKREELVWRVARQHPLGVGLPSASTRVLSTGQSEWRPHVNDETCVAFPENTDPEIARSLRFHSFLCVPLPVHGQILGTISIARATENNSYTSADLALAEELARRAGLAVDHARLYRASQYANRTKEEFLATLSHELRSPLSSAMLCVQMLRRGVLDAERTARALETIERKIRLEVRLVDDLIDIARINAGKVSFERKRVHLARVVDAAVESARPVAEAQGVRLRFSPGELDTTVDGDEGRLHQVIDNLLSNAIKFTPKGGSIDVALEHAGDEARITVRDTGIGIHPDALPRIFDHFRQGDTSVTRKYGGLGLGLAIVRTLVELHGGNVIAESPGEGRGSTFVLTLPRLPDTTYAPPPSAVAPRERPAEMKDLSNVFVLLVDDDADALDSMATLLSGCGATVTKAGSTREALEILRRGGRAQDVLVSDISMPETDGYELLRAVRRGGGAGDAAVLPAIAVTAYAGQADRQMAFAAGYLVHLAKPVDGCELVAAVADLGGKSGVATTRSAG